jgi:hypothetical protein
MLDAGWRIEAGSEGSGRRRASLLYGGTTGRQSERGDRDGDGWSVGRADACSGDRAKAMEGKRLARLGCRRLHRQPMVHVGWFMMPDHVTARWSSARAQEDAVPARPLTCSPLSSPRRIYVFGGDQGPIFFFLSSMLEPTCCSLRPASPALLPSVAGCSLCIDPTLNPRTRHSSMAR